MTPEHAHAARELLAFYLEAGVEDLVDEAPVDRFAQAAAGETAPQQAPQQAPGLVPDAPPPQAAERSPGAEGGFVAPSLTRVAPPPRARANAPLPPDAAVMAARDLATSAATLDELRALVDGFQGCALRLTAKQLVFGDGNPQARVMFVGEAPGREEDIEGRPFVGRSGQLLDRMLATIGLDRGNAYIANIIPWRPPGNRDPSPQETLICLPFIRRQIALVDPDIMVCLGKPSTAGLLGLSDGIKRTRGRWQSFDTGIRQIRALPTFHPAYLLRSPLDKRLAWRDLLAIKMALDGTAAE